MRGCIRHHKEPLIQGGVSHHKRSVNISYYYGWKALRSRKRDDSVDSQATDFSQSPVMFTDNPSEQVDKVAETISSEVSVGIPSGGQLAGSSSNGVVVRNGETSSGNSVQIIEQSSQQDLLSIIWQTMQQDRKKDKEFRVKEK